MFSLRMAAIAWLGLVTFAGADPINIFVPGTADPYLAGMPAGSTASGYTPSSPGASVAPANSPLWIAVTPGGTLTFTAKGTAAYGPMPTTGPDTRSSGPDGMPYFGQYIHHLAGPQNGMSDAWLPINALVGVFLGDSAPNGMATPAMLDYRSGGNVAGGVFASTQSPALQQVFFLGDGLDDLGNPQTIVIPEGATRLFLGVADGWDWANNRDGYQVTLQLQGTEVPEPGSLLLGGLALGCLGGYLRGYRRRSPRSAVATCAPKG